MKILLLAIALIAALAVACRDDNSDEPSAGTPTPSTEAPASPTLEPATPTGAAPRARCAPLRPHQAGGSNETIRSGGDVRSYILYVPDAYVGGEALPMVLNLHGYGSGSTQQAAYSDFHAKAGDEGFIVVTPQALGTPAYWNISGRPALGSDDVAFFGDLLDELTSSLCVDASRIYSAGISNGAAMSLQLSCELADRIAAVGDVSGTFFPAECPGDRRVPIIAFHGTADAVVPYEGGPLGAGLGERFGLTSAPVEDSIAKWAERNGCEAEATEEQVTDHVRRLRYTGCLADVDFYAIEGGGHSWPGAADVPRLGTTTHEISATGLIWEFFVAHPLE